MKIEKHRNSLVGLYITTALFLALGGVAITATTSLTFGNTVPALVLDGHACLVYESIPAQVHCTTSTSSNNVYSV